MSLITLAILLFCMQLVGCEILLRPPGYRVRFHNGVAAAAATVLALLSLSIGTSSGSLPVILVGLAAFAWAVLVPLTPVLQPDRADTSEEAIDQRRRLLIRLMAWLAADVALAVMWFTVLQRASPNAIDHPSPSLPFLTELLPLLRFATGLTVATLVGARVLPIVIRPHLPPAGAGDDRDAVDGLPGGGRVIGLLERAIIFGLVAAGQPQGVGFLLAAKSILRFGEVREPGQRAAAEYIIIGTLSSFGWALLVAWGVALPTRPS